MMTLRGSAGRTATFVASGLIACSASIGTAAAQSSLLNSGPGTSLPPSDTSVRTDLFSHFTQSGVDVGGRGPAGPPITITPSIDLAEILTDNAFAGSGGKASGDLITQITPSVVVTGTTSRVNLNLTYSPFISIYARNSSQDTVAQNIDGSAHAVLIPETLFLDLRAFAGLQSATGGVSNQTINTQDRNNLAQTYSFSVAPYLQHRFGGWGIGELGYTASYSSTNGLTGFNNGTLSASQVSPQLFQAQQQFNSALNTHVFTQNEHAAFNSGENLGRINVKLLGSATQYTGNGVYRNAHNNFGTIDLAYAINRYVAAVGEIGYEDLAYSGIPPVQISDVIWAAGAKLTPSPDTSVLGTFGHRFGRPNVFFSGNYAATARLRFFARYSQALTTNLEDIQNTLSQIDIDASGGVYDRGTGAPVAVVDTFLGLDNGVFRLNRGSLDAVLIYDRDTFTFSLTHETRKLVSASPDTFSTASSRGTFGSLSWQHSVNPALTANAYLQYGKVSQSGLFSNNQDSYTASLGVSYALSETLTARSSYTYSRTASFLPGQTSAQNYLLVGLHKQF